MTEWCNVVDTKQSLLPQWNVLFSYNCMPQSVLSVFIIPPRNLPKITIKAYILLFCFSSHPCPQQTFSPFKLISKKQPVLLKGNWKVQSLSFWRLSCGRKPMTVKHHSVHKCKIIVFLHKSSPSLIIHMLC